MLVARVNFSKFACRYPKAARCRIVWAVCSKKAFSSSVFSEDTTSHLRLAHASEIFRSNFYEANNVSTSVSCLDLDQLIVSERARPSLLICPFEVAGKTLGVIAKYSPSSISTALLEVVDEATIQIYNDSIRDMQHLENGGSAGNNDIKEALKYHREIKASASSETGAAEDSSAMSSLFGRKEIVAAGLRNVLSLAKSV